MLTTNQLNEAVLGPGWRWDPDDEILWVRAFVGPYQTHTTPVEIIASFIIVEADGVPVGYRDPEWYVEYDVRDAACERVHYAHLPLTGASEVGILEWLRHNSIEAELAYEAAIERVRRMSNEVDTLSPRSRRGRAPVAGDAPVPVPEGRKQRYTVAYRVTGTFTYDVEASSPECAFHAGDKTSWEQMEFESDEIHAITVSFDAPNPPHGWKHVQLGEDELDLENHGMEDELEARDAGG